MYPHLPSLLSFPPLLVLYSRILLPPSLGPLLDSADCQVGLAGCLHSLERPTVKATERNAVLYYVLLRTTVGTARKSRKSDGSPWIFPHASLRTSFNPLSTKVEFIIFRRQKKGEKGNWSPALCLSSAAYQISRGQML